MMSARLLTELSISLALVLSPISNSLGMPIKCKQRQTRVKIKTTAADIGVISEVAEDEEDGK